MINKSDFNPECITLSQMKLIFNARMYYKRITAWASAYILSRYFGIGTADELFGHLYLEALDLADVLKIFFGREDSAKYAQLLGQFAILLRDIISAQIYGDSKSMTDHINLLAQNIEERVAFLHSLNPFINQEAYQDMLRIYIQNLLEYANILVTGDYERDIEVYDNLDRQADRIGDAFAESLYNYMISDFNESDRNESEDSMQCITYNQLNVVLGTKMFWFDLVIWIRNYTLSKILGIGLTDRALDQLNNITNDFLNFGRQIFGEETAKSYTIAFDTYIKLLDAYIDALMEGNTERINELIPLLHQNAIDRATIPTRDNPYWDEEYWTTMVTSNLRYTLEEITALFVGDYARNLDIFRTLLNQAEEMGNEFERGYFKYLNSAQTQAKELI